MATNENMNRPTQQRTLTAKFHRTLEAVRGCPIDMYYLFDDPDGDGSNIISLGVPHGDKDTPPYIAAAANAHDALVARVAELEAALGKVCDDNTTFMVAVNGHLGDKLESWSKDELAEALGHAYATAQAALARGRE